MVNQISSERKVKRNFGTSKSECFEGPLRDILKTSWDVPKQPPRDVSQRQIIASLERHFETSPERHIRTSSRWSNRFLKGILGTLEDTYLRRTGDQYLPTSLVDKYNNTYHFSIGNKLINAGYSPLSVKKYLWLFLRCKIILGRIKIKI